jgi:hypothetical protein
MSPTYPRLVSILAASPSTRLGRDGTESYLNGEAGAPFRMTWEDNSDAPSEDHGKQDRPRQRSGR